MDIGGLFKIDSWWKALFWIGPTLCAISVIFDVDFLEGGHLFGLGVGFFLIGLSYWIAQKYVHIERPRGYYEGNMTIHNNCTIVMLVAGIVISICFLIRILIGLW